MAKASSLRQSDLENIVDHRENTASIMVKAYTRSQISMIDNVDMNTVKNSPKYIPVRVDSGQSNHRKRALGGKGYSIRYIMVSELEKIMSLRCKKDIRFFF